MKSVKVSNVFNTFNFETTFLKNEKFKKLEYRFLIETTKIENTSFSFKTALSETNVKTNRMATTKWTYHKEWSVHYLPVTLLYYFGKFVPVLEPLKKS